jgi:hypothetical protein
MDDESDSKPERSSQPRDDPHTSARRRIRPGRARRLARPGQADGQSRRRGLKPATPATLRRDQSLA